MHLLNFFLKCSIKPYIFWVSFMWQQRFWYFPHKWLVNWYMSRRPIASQNPMSNHGYPYPLSRKVKLSNQIPGIENQGATNLAKCQVVGTPVAKSWCLLRSADNATYVAQCSHTYTHTHLHSTTKVPNNNWQICEVAVKKFHIFRQRNLLVVRRKLFECRRFTHATNYN